MLILQSPFFNYPQPIDSKSKINRKVINRDVNGIIKNSLKMPGSRGNALVGGPTPWENLNFHSSTA